MNVIWKYLIEGADPTPNPDLAKVISNETKNENNISEIQLKYCLTIPFLQFNIINASNIVIIKIPIIATKYEWEMFDPTEVKKKIIPEYRCWNA